MSAEIEVLRSALSGGRHGEVAEVLRSILTAGIPQASAIPFVAHCIRTLERTSFSLGPLYRLRVVGDSTTSPFVDAATVALAAEGCHPALSEASFGLYRQEILDPESALMREQPDGVLIAVGADAAVPYPSVGTDPAGVSALVDQRVDEWVRLWAVLSERLQCEVFQHVMLPPSTQYLGIADRRAAWSPPNFVGEINRRLFDAAPSNVYWVDIEAMANAVGRSHWWDMRLFYHGKLSISPRVLDTYATGVASAWRQNGQRTKKVLVTDLDNTLWGGVIGDDGVDGIELGPDTPAGEAYQAFCTYLLRLKERGIILAVCSKNDEATARSVFTNHPHQPLKLDDFAAFVASWEDKPQNIKRIASGLNIGLDALVFIDDNPGEIKLVRDELPMVRSVMLEQDPAQYINQIDGLGLFNKTKYVPDDFSRSSSYSARRAFTEKLNGSGTDLEGFLHSLKMTGSLRLATAADIPRLSQMESKTNQFNMTTKRLSAEIIHRLMESCDHEIWACSLSDIHANHGIVSSMVTRKEGARLIIESWLMSCRVFGRNLEHFIMRNILEYALEHKIDELRGEYIPTERNGICFFIYEKLGFKREGDTQVWRRKVSERPWPESPIQAALEHRVK